MAVRGVSSDIVVGRNSSFAGLYSEKGAKLELRPTAQKYVHKKRRELLLSFSVDTAGSLLHNQLIVDFDSAVGAHNLHEVQVGFQTRNIQYEFFPALTFGLDTDTLTEAADNCYAAPFDILNFDRGSAVGRI